MKAIQRPRFALLFALIAAFSLTVAEPGHGAITASTSSSQSWWESFFNAVQQWFNSNNSTGSGSGSNSGSGTTNSSSGSTSGSGATTTPNSTTSATESGGAPAATALAQSIARDAGGHADQYAYYADKLAETLAQLSPEQRARVFGGK